MKWLAVVASLAACSASDDGPHLTEVIPPISAPSATIELHGERFCGSHPDCVNVAAKVEIGLDLPMLEARVLSYADTSAMVEVPTMAPAGDTHIVLTVEGRSSNALMFTVGGIR